MGHGTRRAGAPGQGGTPDRERRAALIGRTIAGDDGSHQDVERRARTTSRMTNTSSVPTTASPATPASAPIAPQRIGTFEPGVRPGCAPAPSIHATIATT